MRRSCHGRCAKMGSVSTAQRRPPRVHRVDRHPGRRRHHPQPRPVHRHRAVSAGGGDVALLARQARELGVSDGRGRRPGRGGRRCARRCRRRRGARRPGGVDRARRARRRRGAQRGHGLASGSARRSRPCARAARSRWPTRSRSSSADGSCTPRGSARTRSCRSTPSTRRSRRRCAAARTPRSGGSILTASRRPVPRLVARRRQGGHARSRRSRTRPGRWGRW